MANPYFRKLPSFEYVSRLPDSKIGDYIELKNIFKKGRIRPDIFNELAFFEKYRILGDDRPDNVAFKLYDDSTLDWIVLLSNNIINIQTEWPLTQVSFDSYLREKYGVGLSTEEEIYAKIYDVHHYETIEIKNSQGVTILPAGKIVDEFFKPSPPDKKNLDDLFNDSEVIINDYTASGEIVYLLNNSNISTTNNYGIFVINESKTSWTYTLTRPELVSERKSVSDALEYISQDGVKRTIKIKATEDSFDFSIDLSAEKSSGGISYANYYDSFLDSTVIVTNITTPITNYEYEERLENEKRNIYVLKSRYLNVILDDIETLMEYKEGSTQYVSDTLKRADNIKLYS